MKPKTMTTLHFKKSMCRSPLRLAFFLVPLALTLFALPQMAQAEDGSVGSVGSQNTAEGSGALQNLATNGVRNTAVGFDALLSNTGGGANTALGAAALANNTANNNTACGSYALNANTTGDGNTATGIDALMFNIDGSSNSANGASALFNNTSGGSNTANGATALFSNTSGSANTAVGVNALATNTTGINNTASGVAALTHNNGNFNTAHGVNALTSNTTGINNTANGYAALASNTTGAGNIAIGKQAGVNLTTGSNNIDIGNVGLAGEANKIRIGKTGTQTATFIAGIRGVTVPSGVGVIIGSNGQLGTVTSSARYKEAIKPMDKASEAILALKPVTFRYKHELDPDGVPQFGLVAEQVEKVNSDLVVRDEDGKVTTVRYEAVNAMLLNEFLKEHRNVAEQQSTIAELKTTVAQQQKQIEALTVTVRKVSERVELSVPALRIAANED
jgi:uncharacterized coiled-coil protein SlyX